MILRRHRLQVRLILFLLSLLLCLTPTIARGSTPPATLEQQSRSRYEAGDYRGAIELLEQSIQSYSADGDTVPAALRDRLRQAAALGNLALAHQQLGDWAEAEQAIATSLNLLQGELTQAGQSARSQILNIQGTLQLAQGQAEQALATWEQAAQVAQQAGDRAIELQSQVNQAQALQSLGLYRRSIALLTEVNQTLAAQPASLIQAIALRRLGDALLVVGDLEESRRVLEQSLSMATALPSAAAVTDARLSLANLTRAEAIAQLSLVDLSPAEAVMLLSSSGSRPRQREAAQAFERNTAAAIALYQQAAAEATPTTRMQAQLNQLNVLIETGRSSEATALLPDLLAQLQTLPPSHSSLYDRIGLAQSLIKLAQPSAVQQAQLLLTIAIQQAEQLGDQRARSFALGSLGAVDEQAQQWAAAQTVTQQALISAEAIGATDIAYRWQWQMGRLLKAQGNRTGAIAAYIEAVSSLQTLRRDLIAINRDVQFSFREGVEPVYRQLVDLLLQPGSDQPQLRQARSVIEGLQIAELDNFFREACLDTQFQLDRVVDQAQLPAAIFYTITLPDRLEVILKLPQQNLLHYTAAVSQAEVEQTVEAFLFELKRPFVARPQQDKAEQLYNWLIRPAEAALQASQAETLVFVLDGTLRNIPMAALSDGQQYLVERYSLALAPGLQLPDPQPIDRQQIRALVAGLSEARSNFPALNFVETEVDRIQADVRSEVLFNASFTKANLRDRLQSSPFSIVHIATHGQFSSNAAETFILAWDDPISVNELSQLLEARGLDRRDPIELLVLSACQTAAGDRRAALGLAGVAVRAGARSTIASLWNLDDNSGAALMSEFYRELVQPSRSKAEALRRAQLALLANPRYRAPRFWAPYVLLGNWL